MLEEPKYLIVINMYVGNGYVETGRLSVGADRTKATELFWQLNGNPVTDEIGLLRLDLIARDGQGLDTVLHTLGCTLQELSENMKVIMVETFRILNLE